MSLTATPLPELPGYLWPLFVILLVLVTASGLFFWLARRRRVAALEAHYIALRQQVEALEGHSVDNGPRIAELLHASGDEALSEGFARMQADSQALYLGRWFPAGDELATLASALSPRDYRLLGAEAAQSVGIIGVLASLALTLALFIDRTSRGFSTSWPLMLLPALIGLGFALLLAVQASGTRGLLSHQLRRLASTIERRLPVYADRAGAALLVEEFSRYDREMKGSVERLQASADGLVHDDLARAVSGSIDRVLAEQVSPPLREAGQALGELATELARKQEEGMAQLADRFSAELGTTLEQRLDPLFTLIGNYAESIADARQQAQLTSESISGWLSEAGTLAEQSRARLEEERQSQAEWQAQSSQLLSAWHEEATRWQGEWAERQTAAEHRQSEQRDELTAQLERLTGSTGQLAELQAGNEATLAQRIAEMSEALDRFTEDNRAVIAGLGEAHERVVALVESNRSDSQKLLAEYRRLTQEIGTTATGIEKHAAELAATLARLNHELQGSVSQFTTRLQQGVDDTIREFDSGLADISLRLAHTTAEVNESVDRMQDQLDAQQRRSEEH